MAIVVLDETGLSSGTILYFIHKMLQVSNSSCFPRLHPQSALHNEGIILRKIVVNNIFIVKFIQRVNFHHFISDFLKLSFYLRGGEIMV